jgi:hypothetical protein
MMGSVLATDHQSLYSQFFQLPAESIAKMRRHLLLRSSDPRFLAA